MKQVIRRSNSLALLAILLFCTFFSFITISSGFAEDFQENQAFDKTTQARLAVEKAWETYHHAALGGTLASPTIQTELEMNLHKSRGLLAEAYDAEDKKDLVTVDQLTNQIMNITKRVITESREPKR
jgi:hypothetical protein